MEDFEAEVAALASISLFAKEKAELLAQRQAHTGAGLSSSRKAHESAGLKSDMKKATAFVKKLRSINTEGLQQCIRDTESLNLSRHIEEIVGAILETQF